MTDPTGSLCIVPARGGSKRIPRKNVRPFLGIPVLTRTVDTIRAAGIVDRVVVSTDDDEIAEVAADAGAEVPFRRPAELADDHATTRAVVADALRRLDAADPVGTVWVVYPTAVLVLPDDLRRAGEEFATGSCELAMSVVASPMPIERAWRRSDDGIGTMVHPEHGDTRTQDLPAAYFDAGQFYVGTRRFWLGGPEIVDARPLLIELPRERVVDLDTVDDWRFAEVVDEVRRQRPSD